MFASKVAACFVGLVAILGCMTAPIMASKMTQMVQSSSDPSSTLLNSAVTLAKQKGQALVYHQRKAHALARRKAQQPLKSSPQVLTNSVSGWDITLSGLAGVIFSGTKCPMGDAADFSATQIGYFECSPNNICALNQGYLFIPGESPQIFYLTCEVPESSSSGTPLKITTYVDNTCSKRSNIFNLKSDFTALNTQCMSPVTVLSSTGNSMYVVGGLADAIASIGAGGGGVGAGSGDSFPGITSKFYNPVGYCNSTSEVGGLLGCTAFDTCQGPFNVLNYENIYARCYTDHGTEDCNGPVFWFTFNDADCNYQSQMYVAPLVRLDVGDVSIDGTPDGNCVANDAGFYYQKWTCANPNAASALVPTVVVSAFLLCITILSSHHIIM